MKSMKTHIFCFVMIFVGLVYAEVYNFKDVGRFYYSGRDDGYSDGWMTGASGKVEIDEKLKHRVDFKVYKGDQLVEDLSLRIESIIDSFDTDGSYKGYVGTLSNGPFKDETAAISIHGKYLTFRVMQRYDLFFDFYGSFGEDGLAFGSGFAVNSHTIITNQHVVSGLDLFWATQYGNGTKIYHELEIVHEDPLLDLAVLSSKDSLTACEVDRNVYGIGEEVFAYGYPQMDLQGKSLKATKGIISSRMGYRNSAHGYQIDAAVQPGNSGGPLARDGKVVGIVSSRLKGDSQLVNYAIKSNFLMAILDVLNIQNDGVSLPKECTYSIQGQSYRFYNERRREENKVQKYIQGIGD